MSVTINDKVLDSIVGNFQAYTNPSQPLAAFSDFEAELKERMEAEGLTNLDDSKEGKKVVAWIQEIMPEYGGSVQSPLGAEAILAWDDEAFAAVENEPETSEDTSEITTTDDTSEDTADITTTDDAPKETDTEKPDTPVNDNIADIAKRPIPEESEELIWGDDDATEISLDETSGSLPLSGSGALGRILSASSSTPLTTENSDGDIDITLDAADDKKDAVEEIDLREDNKESDIAQADKAFIDDMKKVKGSGEWKGGDLPSKRDTENPDNQFIVGVDGVAKKDGTLEVKDKTVEKYRDGITGVKIWFRDKTTGKPAEGSPVMFDKNNLDMDKMASLVKGTDQVEVYGAELFFVGGEKVWASSANTSSDDFKKILDRGQTGIKWINYAPNLYVTDEQKEKNPDAKPAKEYDNGKHTDISNVIDLGGGRYAWKGKEGEGYWADMGNIENNEDKTIQGRLKAVLTLKDDAGNPLALKDEKDNPLAINILNKRSWKMDFVNTSGKHAIDYESIVLRSTEVDGEKREFFAVKGFVDGETGTRPFQSYFVEKNAKHDAFYDLQHLFSSLLKIKPDNYDKMSTEEKDKTTFKKLTNLAKNGHDQLLWRSVGDNDARYGSMHTDAFKEGKPTIELLEGNYKDGNAIWKVDVKGHGFIVSQEIMPNNIDKHKVELKDGTVTVGTDDMSREDSWKKMMQFLDENDNK